jgi:hypothetical protein
MCHPNVETWAWICVATASIPGARSPDITFTNCQALIYSSKSNPAPFIDRNVAGAGFTLSPRDDFSFELFLDEAIFFRIHIPIDCCHIVRRVPHQVLSKLALDRDWLADEG